MKKEALGFKVAAWVLTVSAVVPKDEVRRRLRKAITEELRLVIKKGTTVKVKCPMCFQPFQYEVPSDNAPVKLYCSPRCSKTAAKRRNNPNYAAYCATPHKNQYPTQDAAVAVMGTMHGEHAWKLNAYPCPVGHWHIGRVQGRIVSTEKE